MNVNFMNGAEKIVAEEVVINNAEGDQTVAPTKTTTNVFHGASGGKPGSDSHPTILPSALRGSLSLQTDHTHLPYLSGGQGVGSIRVKRIRRWGIRSTRNLVSLLRNADDLAHILARLKRS